MIIIDDKTTKNADLIAGMFVERFSLSIFISVIDLVCCQLFSIVKWKKSQMILIAVEPAAKSIEIT